jgi:FkbM family methyltransferase
MPDSKASSRFAFQNGFNELASCRGGLFLYNRHDVFVGASLRKYGEFSAGEAAIFRHLVVPGATVVEIGANIGAHTVDLSRLAGPTGLVHALEPQRLVFQTLCANLALNSCANVFARQAAAGAADGTLLVPALDPCATNNFGGLSLAASAHGETVPLITIDSLALPSCQMLKIDVEGMEAAVLQGAAATIARCRPLLYVENDRADRSAGLIGLLQSYRYRMFWHTPPLYEADNFRHDPENIFPRVVSANMLCVPAESPVFPDIFREVSGPDDTWQGHAAQDEHTHERGCF